MPAFRSAVWPATLLFLLAALVMSVTPACAQLAPNGSVSGTLNAATTQLTFSFTADADGNATFTFDPVNTLQACIRFLDSDGTTQVAQSTIPATGNNATLTIVHLSPGATYFVSAVRNNGSGDFTLSNVYTPQAIVNDVEPNNTFDTGLDLAMPTSVTGHIGYSRASYNDLDVEDWYKLTVPQDGNLQLTLTQTSASQAHIQFYDSDGTTRPLQSAVPATGNNATLTIPHLAPGATYYIRIIRDSGYGGYTLSGTLTSPPQSNDAEPNNSALQATRTLSFATATQGHIGYSRTSYNDLDTEDWYKLTVSQDANVTLTLTQTSASQAYLQFYDSDGTTLKRETSIPATGNNATLTITHLGAGTIYYVRVLRNNGYGGYTLTGALTPPGVSNDAELNDSAVEATASIPMDGRVNGHIGYSRATYDVVDTQDWYKMVVPRDGNITLTLSQENTSQAYLQFYDSDGTTQQLQTSIPATGNNATLTIPHLGPGTIYYVRVLRNGGYGGYILTNRFHPMYVTNDAEQNDSSASAIAVGSLSGLTGHIGYSRANYDTLDVEDWYAFTHPGGNFSVNLRNTDASQAYLQLYNADGVTLRASSSIPATGNTATLNVTNLSAGNYFLRVLRNNGYGAYGLNAAATVTVSGTITLEDCDDDAEPVTVEFRPVNGDPVLTFTVDSGTFSISDLPRINYNVYFKGAKWLARIVLVQTEVGNATDVDVLLKGGDADDSNIVDVLDLDVLIQTFDLCEGDGGFDTRGDLNCDGCTDVLDLDLLIRNFDSEGDS
jgi:hypothetical protein